MEDTEERLVAALDSATTWSAYCENQLSAAVTLTNAQEHPERVLRCVDEALFAASQVVARCGELKALAAVAELLPPPPGAAVQVDVAYCRRCSKQLLADGDQSTCQDGAPHDWTRELR